MQNKLAPDDVYIVVVLETHPAEGVCKVAREDGDKLEEEGVGYRRFHGLAQASRRAGQ